MSEEGAVFARSGAFRVDRALALEKLSRFALARGELFLLPWLRSAVAARARRLRADGAMSLRVAFDGDAFTREELADPYAALLQEAGGPRLRHFAIGLLTCLRTEPAEVRLESGRGADRVRLVARTAREERLEPAGGSEVDTVLTVRWPLLRSRARAALAAAAQAAPLVPEGFLLAGASPRAPAGPGHERFELAEGSASGLLRLPEPGASQSVVSLCLHGVEADRIQTWVPWGQVRAWVDDDAFRLDASQSAVVEDERRKAALDAVSAAAERFLARSARLLTERLARDREGLAGLQDWVIEASRLLLTDPASDGARPLLKALWDAPLFQDVSLEPLTLRELAAEKARHGVVGWSSRPCRSARPARRVALARPDTPAFACLKGSFAGDLRDLTPLIDSLEAAS